MSSSNDQQDVEIHRKNSVFTSRNNTEETFVSDNSRVNENRIYSQDQETMELYSRAGAQEKEIQYLKEKIALASINESQLLNEKYDLERKFAQLRMALDEKQNEIITSASNELARRKGDLEVNVNLLNELKAVEDEKHIFTSYLLGILADYGAWPHVTNASSLSNSIKHLHDQLQLKIKSSHVKLMELNSMIGNNPGYDFVNKEVSSNSMGARGLPNNQSLLRTFPDIIDRNIADQNVENFANRNAYPSPSGPDQGTSNQFSDSLVLHGGGDFYSEEGPGIEGFQITGDAKPGGKLLGCGYPVRGTSLCMFQWVRHYPDGTRQYIEGATNPDYVVTADDVDKLIAVECIPMDEQGRPGEIVRIFANDHNKITCDEEIQEEIDAYISKGLATFSVLILVDSSENWEVATIFLRRSGFQVTIEGQNESIISEKYSKELLIKVPSGLSTQFVLTCSNGSSYPFSTNNDIRMRDTLVLTMRIFQSKALDEKKKGKV